MKKSERLIKLLPILFCVMYMVSYMTRINYGAIISEMQAATNFSKQMLSMALTGAFITYGAGQIVTGVLVDKYSPKKLVLCGLGMTVCMNSLIPLCQNPWQMLVVWCVNGFAQSFMWPPIVKLMTIVFNAQEYQKAMVTVHCGGSFGTIAIYILAPMLISVGGWKTVFIFCACCGIGMMICWQCFCPDINTKETTRIKVEEKSSGEPLKSNVYLKKSQEVSGFIWVSVLVAIMCTGMLRDGVTTWMPSLISETYKMSNVVAILSGVLLPVFGIVCFKISQQLYSKKFTNPVSCAGVIFAAGAAVSVLLYVAQGTNVVISILLMALLTGCMHGVNMMLVGMLPPFLSQSNNVGTVSGIMNATIYIGSAISAYGLATITDVFGWSMTILVWVVAALVGTGMCFIISKCGNIARTV